ncbi:O-antigen ligase [Acidisphaera sp. S103]|uniref:O-antigen ligase family protein n=1 Tax=Acidisphaera sp. S103 TaxID=1747223 RepID=UPI00131C885C|nr:O-antigen ligase family protein [Acidisphaera sp. S103]
MPPTLLATTIERGIDRSAPVLVFAALPTLGLAAGPSYSSLIIGLAVVQLLSGLAAGRGLPPIDRPVAAIAGLFLALCWASVIWSIDQRESIRAAAGLTGVLVALLMFRAGRYGRPESMETLFHVLLIATLVGVGIAWFDVRLGYPLEALISTKPGVHAATKYNRGFDYLVLIAWPLLAHVWWRRRWWSMAALGIAIAMMLAVTLSLAGRVAVVAGVVVLLLAWAAPRLVAIGLGWGVAAFVVTLPVVLRLLAERRTELARFLKPSGVARLEIWDYMTARVFEHPIGGWGLRTATHLPIRPDELASYIYVDARGIYPHNQWLELWVELGVLGAALGLVFALLLLWRICELPAALRPFAYAAFASAMTIASVNYEVVTDSWWCALAASAVLFGILGQLLAGAGVDDRSEDVRIMGRHGA